MSLWDRIISLTKETNLSDIHIGADSFIAYREFGDMVQTEEMVTSEDLREFLQEVMSDVEFMEFIENKDYDLAIEKDGFRFRVNAFFRHDKSAIVLRYILSDIPVLSKLNLPPYVATVPSLLNGLVLVTGPTGSGKTTTLAALIDVINETTKGHILTIEDPVEFRHINKKCVVSQREIRRDTRSFLSALRASLREDPDVILVGEMRDLETIQLALTAAETGHLVFGTLHTNSAPSTLTRIIDVFPPAQQEQVRSQLSNTLRCVLTQRLLKRMDQPGRVAAFELMICNVAIRNLVRENKVFQIPNIMQTAKGEGMITMENSLRALVASGLVSPEEAGVDVK